MSKVLVINVRFYDGRYHGAGDWPPAPARLFQAMIAGAGLRGVLDARVKQVLGQFELLEPPVIAAPFATKGQRVDNFVPNNDLDSAQGNPRNIGSIRSKKVIQPRIFDAGQVFRYAWTLPESEDAGLLESGLQDLAAGIYQLGRGVDLAWAWLEVLTAEDFDEGLRSYPGRVYRPGGSGEGTDVLTLNCPAPGSLASLERRYQAAAERFELFVAGRTVSQSFRQAPKAHFRGVVYDSPPARKLYELRELSAESPFAPWPVEKTVDLV
jgi:CRISPR-associated protein Csb2